MLFQNSFTMRYILILSMVINCTCYGQFNEFVFPHACNSFLNSGNICWAAEAYEQFSFAGSVSADGQNVYNRLTLLALSGELAAYDLRLKFNGFSKLENGIYKDADLFAGETLTKEQINFILLDSLKTIKFHEIFYLDNYMLKCHLASAAPLTNFALSTGESLGLQENFFCCINNQTDLKADTANGSIIRLKKIHRALNFDSERHFRILKQTFVMTAPQSIWFGASTGHLKIFDLIKNEFISADTLMKYTFLDSVRAPQ